MSKEMLKNLIELVPEEDVETLYKVVVKFVPADKTKPEVDKEQFNMEYLKKIDQAMEQRKNGTMQEHELIEVE